MIQDRVDIFAPFTDRAHGSGTVCGKCQRGLREETETQEDGDGEPNGFGEETENQEDGDRERPSYTDNPGTHGAMKTQLLRDECLKELWRNDQRDESKGRE
jgi:hypothetical protein